MGRLRSWTQDIFSEDDGQAICVAKVLAVLAFFSFLGYAGFGLYEGHFDLGGFAQGLMMVLAGSGAIIAGKQFGQRG